jgi:hypothetical protein
MATLHDLKPDKANARKHNPRNTGMIARSLQETGFGRSILLANDGTILAGNATVDAAGEVGLDDVLIVETDGTKVIAVKRTDLDPGSEMATKLALYDNRTAELASWDADVLDVLKDEMDLSGLFYDDELLKILNDTPTSVELPADFASYDESIETQYCCPKCRYEWSGSPK